jgi:hypothetical protein
MTESAVTGFRESNRIVHPSVGAFDLILRRQGNTLLLSRVRIQSYNHTVDGFQALPGVHYTLPNPGEWLLLPPGVGEQVVPVTILPQALSDLEATRQRTGVLDSIIEFKVVLVEGVNTLLPPSEDGGLAVTVRISLQGRPIPVSRFGEPAAAMVTLACCVGALVLFIVVRHYRNAQEERRSEEHLRLMGRKEQEAMLGDEEEEEDWEAAAKRSAAVVFSVKHPRGRSPAQRQQRGKKSVRMGAAGPADVESPLGQDSKGAGVDFGLDADVDAFKRARRAELAAVKARSSPSKRANVSPGPAGATAPRSPSDGMGAGAGRTSSSPKRRVPKRNSSESSRESSPECSAGPDTPRRHAVEAAPPALPPATSTGANSVNFSFASPASGIRSPAATSPGATTVWSSAHTVVEFNQLQAKKRG